MNTDRYKTKLRMKGMQLNTGLKMKLKDIGCNTRRRIDRMKGEGWMEYREKNGCNTEWRKFSQSICF